MNKNVIKSSWKQGKDAATSADLWVALLDYGSNIIVISAEQEEQLWPIQACLADSAQRQIFSPKSRRCYGVAVNDEMWKNSVAFAQSFDEKRILVYETIENLVTSDHIEKLQAISYFVEAVKARHTKRGGKLPYATPEWTQLQFESPNESSLCAGMTKWFSWWRELHQIFTVEVYTQREHAQIVEEANRGGRMAETNVLGHIEGWADSSYQTGRFGRVRWED